MQSPQINWASEWLVQPKKLYVGSEWILGSGEEFQSRNPANGSILNTYKMASATDVDRAVESADSAFKDGRWSKLPRRKRAHYLKRLGNIARDFAEELATLDSLSNGKLYREALNDDMPDCGDIFDYYAGWVDKYGADSCPVEEGFINYTRNEPVGVCGLIVPWNFPLLLACWKMAPALAMGNTIVVKPSEYTPFSLLRFFELIDEKMDLPAGVIHMLLGDGRVGDQLTGNAKVAKVSFTGSTSVGKRILHQSADSNLKRVTLELGGKSPNIMFEDTPNLDNAIERSFALMFSHKGEKCTEPTRFFIQQGIYDYVLSKLIDLAEKVRCGDPFDPSSDQGPQCNQDQYEKILKYIELGKKEGAKLVAGGYADVSGANTGGYYVRPTIFADAKNEMRICQEEIFGPVLTVLPFKEEAEVVRLANASIYGLAAGLYTQDISRAHRMAADLDAGMIFVNRYGCYDFASPFGGFKQSGWGKEMAWQSLQAFTKTKSVWIALE